jgi:hypothetical protein
VVDQWRAANTDGDGAGAHSPIDVIDVPIRVLSVIAFPDSRV